MSSFFHFDRYNCTFPPSVAPSDLSRAMRFCGDPVPTYPRAKGYRQALSFGDVAFLMSEPTAGNYGCHLLVAGGDSCQPIVTEVRSVLPEHRVSRVDVAADFDYPGAWKDLEGIALRIALEHKPKPLMTEVHGDHYQHQTGRTSTFGSRTSTHFLRVYEKGFEMRQKGLIPNASVDWVRAEIEIKPTKKGDARRDAASLSPDELAFSNSWCSEFARSVGAKCGLAVRLSTKRTKSAFEAMLYHMAQQYGPAIRKAIRSGETDKMSMMQFFEGVVLNSSNRLDAKSEILKNEKSENLKKRIWNFLQYGTYDGIKKNNGDT